MNRKESPKHKHQLEVETHVYEHGSFPTQVSKKFIWYCKECVFLKEKTVKYLENTHL